MIEFITSPSLQGSITMRDLLNNEGTFTIVVDNESFCNGGFLFQLIDRNTSNEFIFTLSIQNKAIVLQRNDTISILTLNDTNCKHYFITITWSFNELHIYTSIGNKDTDIRHASVMTSPITPPNSLLKWARKNNLIPVVEFGTEEAFRNKIHSCLISIQDKLIESGSYSQFWNIVYDGKRIIERNPKNEIEVQPIIHCLLSDQFLMSSIEIIPEYNSSVGNLDFLFIAKVKDIGFAYFCVEFKNAHSTKIENGLLEQLPSYMETKKAKYGAYCVLNYEGQYFTNPNFNPNIESYLEVKRVLKANPYTDNTRIFIYQLSKPISASKI